MKDKKIVIRFYDRGDDFLIDSFLSKSYKEALFSLVDYLNNVLKYGNWRIKEYDN